MSSSFLKKIRKLSIGRKLTGNFWHSEPRRQDKQRQNGRNARIAFHPFFLKKFRKILFLSQNFVQRGNDVVDVFDAD